MGLHRGTRIRAMIRRPRVEILKLPTGTSFSFATSQLMFRVPAGHFNFILTKQILLLHTLLPIAVIIAGL